MPRYSKPEDFEAGLAVVSPFFESLGYTRKLSEPFWDKDGYLLDATFSNGPRSVELHHQYSLGPVRYRMDEFVIEHLPYLEALGVAAQAHYPSYEDNSHSGYPALLYDLQTLLSPFFHGPEQDFIEIASRAKKPHPKGIHAV
jgi:hypothetical protein